MPFCPDDSTHPEERHHTHCKQSEIVPYLPRDADMATMGSEYIGRLVIQHWERCEEPEHSTVDHKCLWDYRTQHPMLPEKFTWSIGQYTSGAYFTIGHVYNWRGLMHSKILQLPEGLGYPESLMALKLKLVETMGALYYVPMAMMCATWN